MSKLSDQIITLINASGISDDDQRSAIGMARTWVDKREPITWNPNQVEYPKRDQLAKDIVAVFEANPVENEEYIEALSEARTVINEPFQVNAHSGQRLAKPGEKKRQKEIEK